MEILYNAFLTYELKQTHTVNRFIGLSVEQGNKHLKALDQTHSTDADLSFQADFKKLMALLNEIKPTPMPLEQIQSDPDNHLPYEIPTALSANILKTLEGIRTNFL